MSKPAVFFLTSAKTGTHWYEKNLNKHYGDLVHAVHEIDPTVYQPVNYYRCFNDIDKELENENIKNHIDFIKEVTKNKIYVETGFTNYAAIPLMIEQFPNIKLVHIIRNPVDWLYSIVRSGYYHRPFKCVDDYELYSMIRPSHPNAIHKDKYLDEWSEYANYERFLFFWSELHTYFGELFYRYKFDYNKNFTFFQHESLLEDDDGNVALKRLLNFLELPERPEFFLDKKIKEGHNEDSKTVKFKRDLIPDPQCMLRFDTVMALAKSFQYNVTFSSRDSGELLYDAERGVNKFN